MESGIESSQTLCLELGQEVSKDFRSFVLTYLGWESRHKTLENKDGKTPTCAEPGMQKGVKRGSRLEKHRRLAFKGLW